MAMARDFESCTVNDTTLVRFQPPQLPNRRQCPMVSGDGPYKLVCVGSNPTLRTKLTELVSIIKLNGNVFQLD